MKKTVVLGNKFFVCETGNLVKCLFKYNILIYCTIYFK